MEHRFHPGDRVRIADDAYPASPRWNGKEGIVVEHRGRMSDRHGPDLLVLVDAGEAQNAVVGERHLSFVVPVVIAG